MAATAALSGDHGLPGRFSSQQAAILAETARGWLADELATGATDQETAEACMRHAYLAAGLPPPQRVVWLGSPLSGTVAVAMLTGLDAEVPVRDPLWDQVRAQLAAQGQSGVGRIGRPVRPWIEPLVWDQVRRQVRLQTGPDLWEQVWEQTAGEVLRRHPERTWHRQITGMFRTERGAPVNPNHASRAFARLAAGVGLAAHPHLLRHAHASAMSLHPLLGRRNAAAPSHLPWWDHPVSA
jgi:hypothetical protein